MKPTFWENILIKAALGIAAIVLIPVSLFCGLISMSITPPIFEQREYAVITNDPAINAELLVTRTEPLEGELRFLVPWGAMYITAQKTPDTDCGVSIAYLHMLTMHKYIETSCLTIELRDTPIRKITNVSYTFGF